ncbi:hypothetical protein M878_26050 [Streptomyces roseochromogenus subsp. oscitans DS 12.976]|uniref:Uncharacterized protein n=1 Tax=Streptomyces roseochromogenus subsp. oscitans DS 12.976 TaxID=1352936 RepID=V6K431_STRRC|nr:hypothetical protein M878_26050 [Streptomyces roseochromogenus subsp. oscitans DS 12.976]
MVLSDLLDHILSDRKRLTGCDQHIKIRPLVQCLRAAAG